MDMNFTNVSIDVIRGNSVVTNSAVVNADTFTGNWLQLMSGAETACEWDDNGNVTAYAVLHDSNGEEMEELLNWLMED